MMLPLLQYRYVAARYLCRHLELIPWPFSAKANQSTWGKIKTSGKASALSGMYIMYIVLRVVSNGDMYGNGHSPG